MPAAGLAGLIGAGAPPMLYITQPANRTLIVESPINEGHARIYRPGQKTSTPAGQGGTITMTSEWVGNTLVGQGIAVNASGASTTVKEVYSVAADGKTLTVEITASGSADASSSLKYSRIHDVGPCEKWPTPCKRFPRLRAGIRGQGSGARDQGPGIRGQGSGASDQGPVATDCPSLIPDH